MRAAAIVKVEIPANRGAGVWYAVVSVQIDLLVLYRPPQPLDEHVVPPRALAVYADRAAEKGDQFAQYNLSDMFQKGLGVPQDQRQAEEWYLRACRLPCNSPMRAETDLRKFFEFGEGTLGPTSLIQSWPKQDLVYASIGDISPETTPVIADTMKRLSSVTGLNIRREISGRVDITFISEPMVFSIFTTDPSAFIP